MTFDLTVLVSKDSDDLFCPDDSHLSSWINQTLLRADFKEPSAEISIRIVDQRESKELNQHYRSRNKPTNVLSFPAEIPEFVDSNLLGDLAVCSSVVETEAVQQKKPLLHHWAHMVVHGTLHLIGYDHIDEQEAELMEALERNILQDLNIADPYQS